MSFSSYALSIVTVVIITYVSELLLPKGRMKQATSAVFSIIIVLILISPIFSLKNLQFDTKNIFDYDKVYIDESYLDYSNEVRENLLEDLVIKTLKKSGYEGAMVNVETEVYSSQAVIKNVLINFKNLVIIDGNEHINKTEVRQVVAEALDIDVGVVAIVE